MENLKLKDVQNKQHWNTINLLFAEENGKGSPVRKKSTIVQKSDKAIMVCPEFKSIAVNTEVKEVSQETITDTPVVDESPKVDIPIAITVETPSVSRTPEKYSNSQKSLESQLKQAMVLANTRSILLIETENHLNEAQGRIKVLEKSLEEKDKLIKKARESEDDSPKEDSRRNDSILSVSI